MNETDSTTTMRKDTTGRKPISQVLELHTPTWLNIPGVIGTGEGQDPQGNPAIIIMTNVSAADVQAKIPSEVDGYPILVEEVGDVKPLNVD
jgi:hypothetical protein